jgi:hypothetical protein
MPFRTLILYLHKMSIHFAVARRPPVRRPTPLLSAFGGDDEDDKPRALKKLSYTVEELAAGQVCHAHSINLYSSNRIFI